MRLVDVAQPKARLDEMIAGVKIAVVFQRRPVAAGGRVNAQQMPSEKGLERHVEELDVNIPHVVSHPFLENIDEKAAVLLGAHGALGDQIAGLHVEQALLAGVFAPALVGDRRVCSVARSTIGMNCTHLAPSSSRKKR